MVSGVRSYALFVGALSIALPACDSGGSGGEGAGDETGTSGTPTTEGSTSSDDPTEGATSNNPTTGDPTDDPTDDETGNGESTGGDTQDLGQKFELRVGDFAVPAIETSYNCWDFNFSLDQLGHITAFEAVVDNAAHVHHFVVTLTANPSGSSDGYSCYDLEGDMIWAWAPGDTRFELPPEAGFLVGDTPGGSVTLRLQVHYNNPLGVTGETDNSGFDFWITDELRENNAGTLVFGDIEGIQIPPGEPAHEHLMTCRSEVTEAQFPGPLHVFGTSMHAHNLGSVLYSEVYRDDEMILEMNRDDPFDFENQNMKPIDFDLMPGDQIVNHCIYDSTERKETTYGGPGTQDEMCWNTIAYYPKIPSGFDYCSSYD
jgi:hypothetical protein